MTDGAHDMGLIPLLIDSVAHGFAINSEAFVFLSIDLVPALQGAVEVNGLDADEHISDDGFARDEVAAVFVAASEALSGPGTKALSPVRYSSISAHSTKNCPGSDGQNRGKLMSSPLSATGVGDVGKEVG